MSYRAPHLYPHCLGARCWQRAVLCQDCKACGAQCAQVIRKEVNVRSHSCTRASAGCSSNLDTSEAYGLLKSNLHQHSPKGESMSWS